MTNAYPINQAARRVWKNAQDAVTPEALPAPTHTSRDPFPAGLVIPAGPATLASWAEACGWEVRFTYSAGPWLGARGNALRRSIGVRCANGRRFALAFYVSPLDRSAWTLGSSLVAGGPAGVFSRCSVTDVREYLELGGEVPPEWFAGISQRVNDAAARAKQAAKDRPKRAKVATS